ncbi:DUF2742 domain-containing protein [Streptomyces sp. H27-S2]|uniref:DUF2742 domain-containing protein n=1 Tax=Streptomyces antarcticus TaxID=2996458 RepID=UPI00226D5038|nr:DUF2742 domain-containing protein [Streptomyces sp. H27-S2]MCY0952090.1 DUF2742 domain-containing protein [Streptomyces sp. H27-S2]
MTSSTEDRPRLAIAAERGRALRSVPAQATPGQITELRAETQIAALRVTDWPAYGSTPWLQLHPTDPRTYAAVLEAAEQYRRLDVDPDLPAAEWYTAVFGDARATAARIVAATRQIRTMREIRDARARPTSAHQLKATPGWPPIAVPGQPGRYLVHGQENCA